MTWFHTTAQLSIVYSPKHFQHSLVLSSIGRRGIGRRRSEKLERAVVPHDGVVKTAPIVRVQRQRALGDALVSDAVDEQMIAGGAEHRRWLHCFSGAIDPVRRPSAGHAYTMPNSSFSGTILL